MHNIMYNNASAMRILAN